MPWSARFDDPIPIPGRKPLRTPRDEAKFLMGLSRVERIQPHWLDAIEALILPQRPDDVRTDRDDAGTEPREAESGIGAAPQSACRT